ncbi:hypothetical protein [Bradyrhizobium sp. 150]|uniref:ATP-dependent DNA ligase n=1 Tax=Bradyrhizobium sp. 150 TaxID=2782625 RepID=UPI0031F7189A
MLVIRENDRVRLLSRNGTDWTKRYPWIAEAALKNRQKHFVIDGEAVILGADGVQTSMGSTIGPELFRAACRMGLEGLVSKHRDRPYRGGRQKHWIKVKNRRHPAMDREL